MRRDKVRTLTRALHIIARRRNRLTVILRDKSLIVEITSYFRPFFIAIFPYSDDDSGLKIIFFTTIYCFFFSFVLFLFEILFVVQFAM